MRENNIVVIQDGNDPVGKRKLVMECWMWGQKFRESKKARI